MASRPVWRTCAICGAPFQTRRGTETCNRQHAALLREQRHPSPGAPRIEYPADLVAKVREFYEAGNSMLETAEACGTTVKVLQKLMPRHGITRRAAIKRDQRGPLNSSWKGVGACYSAMHLRVRVARGEPGECSCCGTTDPDVLYEWASLMGQMDDVNDYARMCSTCHRRFDAACRSMTGEALTPPQWRHWERAG